MEWGDPVLCRTLSDNQEIETEMCTKCMYMCIWGARMLITDNVWLRKMCLESDSSMFHTVSLSCHLKCHHVFLPITDNSHVFLVLTYMYMYHFHVKQLIYSLVCCLKCDQVSDLKM